MNDEESTHYPRTIRVAARGIAGNKNKIHKDGAIVGRGGKKQGKKHSTHAASRREEIP